MRNTHRLASMFVVASTLASSWAAGPFEVRRALEGSSLDGTADVSVVMTAPFDETLLRSHDASNYYYAVFDASGSPVDISVQRLPGSGVVRLGFDDGNPQSAPVSSSNSSVAATPASIQAGGVEFTTITIVPRDTDGALLGRGLAVSVDAGLLWPVTPTGPVQDMGDGRYVVEGTAMVPGSGSVLATVEGVVLLSSPTVTSTAGTPGSLRDLAILQLRDLTQTGGRLDGAHLSHARRHALEALRTLGSDLPERDDNALKTDLDGTMRELEALGTPEAEALASDLIEIVWMIARWNVDQALAACDSCPKSVAAMAEADAKRAADDGDWGGVVDAYAWAVEMSFQEMRHCGP